MQKVKTSRLLPKCERTVIWMRCAVQLAIRWCSYVYNGSSETGQELFLVVCPIVPQDKHWLDASTQQISTYTHGNTSQYSIKTRTPSGENSKWHRVTLITFWGKTQSVDSIVMPVQCSACKFLALMEVSPVEETSVCVHLFKPCDLHIKENWRNTHQMRILPSSWPVAIQSFLGWQAMHVNVFLVPFLPMGFRGKLHGKQVHLQMNYKQIYNNENLVIFP